MTATTLQLLGTPLSGHTHRVQLFLSLLGLPFDLVPVNVREGENRQPAHLALNPFGEVPVLRDGDLVLSDSTAILVYLAKQYDTGNTWLPVDAVGAARVQQWLSAASGKIAYGPCAARLVTVFGAPLDHQRAIGIAKHLFDVMEPALAAAPFLAGARVTIADIAAFSYIEHAPEGGVDLAPYPHIRAWLDRVRALPGFVAMPATRAGLLA